LSAHERAPATTKISEANERDFKYYGWRVVLAACLGVMGGFGSLFGLHVHCFCETTWREFGWNRESAFARLPIAP